MRHTCLSYLNHDLHTANFWQTLLESWNAKLPDDIRILGCIRWGKNTKAHDKCNLREYEYLLPESALSGKTSKDLQVSFFALSMTWLLGQDQVTIVRKQVTRSIEIFPLFYPNASGAAGQLRRNTSLSQFHWKYHSFNEARWR